MMRVKDITQFVQEVRREFLRIEWPSLKEFLESTVVVLFLTAVFTAFLWALDSSISYAMRHIFTILGKSS